VPEFLASSPFWLTFAFLYLGATLRGQGMYWAGRLVTEQTLRRTHPAAGWLRRVHGWLEGGGADRGITLIRRWGLLAVPLSYLTVGFQSMIQVAAGVLRITWPRYSLAQIPGALAWAAIYSTIGWAVWEAAMAAAAGSPLGLVALAAAVVVIVATFAMHRRKERRAASLLLVAVDDAGTGAVDDDGDATTSGVTRHGR
jgi:membrane protein DedA with SNARE-associated domain